MRDRSFVCMHCNIEHLTVEAVDVSGVIAISRGSLACGPCAEKIFDADAEDREAAHRARKVAEARVCGGLTESGIQLLGIEREAL